MDYLLESTICLTAFYGLYFFGFRRMSFHTLNRFYLLVSLALSLTIPLLSYERTEIVVLEPQPIQEATFAVEETQESTDNQSSKIQQPTITDEVSETTINWISILNTIYLIGVGVMFFLFSKNLLTIFYCIKKATSLVTERSGRHSARSQQRHRKLKILLTKSHSNSSFFNYVFLNSDNLNPHEEALIIAHEGFHAQRLHTLDLLVLGILKAVFWFNPIVYFYQKSLKQIHEYEVDALMSTTHDGREYAHLLLKLGVAPNAMITNQFSTKPLSERIQFLFKTPTKNMKKLLYFLSLPIIAVGVMAFAEEKVVRVYQEEMTTNKNSKQKLETNVSKPKIDSIKTKKTNFETLRQNTVSKIDSSKFSYHFPVMPKNGNVDSIKVIINKKTLVEGTDFIIKNNTIYLDKKYGGLKISYHIYSSSGAIIYPELTKLNKVEFPDMRFSSKIPVFLAKNETKSLPQISKSPSYFSKIARNQDTLRTILEANKLGKNPLVFINGEEYPSSILYRINPDAVVSSSFMPPNSKKGFEKFGDKAQDGVLKLNTKKDFDFLLKNKDDYEIVTDNLRKQMLPNGKHISRIILKDFEGNKTEQISLQSNVVGGINSFSVRLPVGKKAIFFINNVLVSETDVNNYTGDLFYNGYKNKIIEEKYPDEVKKADVIFNLKTKQN